MLPLLQLGLAVLVIAGLQYLLYRTSIGRSFRAVSDDPRIAQLMGLNNRHVFGLAMGLSLAIVALAGVLLAIRANFDPATGPTRLIFGFEAVIIGGLRSFWGTLAGGVILGVVQIARLARRSGLADPRRTYRLSARAGDLSLRLFGQAGMTSAISSSPALPELAPRVVDRRRLSRLRRRARAVLGFERSDAAADRHLPLCRARLPVEFSRGLRGTGLGGSAGLCRPRWLRAVRACDEGRRSAALYVPLIGVVAAIVSVPIAMLLFRLRGAYFAISSWVVAEVFRLAPSLSAARRRLGHEPAGACARRSAGRLTTATSPSMRRRWAAAGSSCSIFLCVALATRSRVDRDPRQRTRRALERVNVDRTKLIVYVVSAFGAAMVGALTFLQRLQHFA